MAEHQRKSGFVAIIGRPNVGKSTLLNRLVGQKIAIMSDKPQTTRTRIRGILTREEGQVVFLDTPGMHQPRHQLGQYMMEIAENSIREVDLVMCVTDASFAGAQKDEYVLDKIKEARVPSVLVLNKVDRVADKSQLLRLIDEYRAAYPFVDIIPISAKTGEQVDVLTKVIYEHLSEGPMYYPEDIVTDHPERFIIAELIREKVLLLTREEIPHSVAVVIEQLETRDDRDVLYINALIYTERDSQKAILIGKNGDLLKKVGMLARHDIESIFGSKVFLELWIKVKKDWRNREHLLRSFGYEQE
ncbi:GTPase Era [Sulfoacidibacillus thermotolerans]|uniref:GTPase Era n=1 Tax=Sulfoacidibacillus thermotolerans TaxID=1765684 RepID=A0A2U3D6F1_SULT2|nr:GTPase Era [Sulfoacidibacillus thermotolerans]PWI56849.1 GTPase Era [Sulfoacidibacillus thermotolerans]